MGRLARIQTRIARSLQPGSHGWLAWLLAGLFALGFMLNAVSQFVRYDLTSEPYYHAALERAGFYDRLYGEVLADPALTEAVAPLLGDVSVDRPYLASTLRLVLPRETVQQGAAIAIQSWVDFLEGKRGTWSPTVNLSAAQRNVVPVISAYVAARTALAPEQVTATWSEFVSAFLPVADDIEAARVPDAVPVFQPADESEAELMASVLLMGARNVPPEGLRVQLVSTLLAGDTRGALSLVVPLYVSPAIESASERLGPEVLFESVVALERMAQAQQDEIQDSIQMLPGLVRVLGSPLAFASAGLMLGSMSGLWWWLPRTGRSPWRWLAASLMAAGAATLVTMALLGAFITALVDRQLAALPGTFPEPLRALLGDIVAMLISEARVGAVVPALLAIAIGGVALGGQRLLEGRRYRLPRRRQLARYGRAAGVGMFVAIILGGISTEVVRALPDGDLMRCNGSRQLCDRRLSEVLFPGTHNSMAAASEGWLFPSHDYGIEAQLMAGYRVLLLDTHYWGERRSLAAFRDRLEPELEPALDALLNRVSVPQPGAFLCHGVCDAGSRSLPEALASITGFLYRHPGEVLILILEDYVSPEDTFVAFSESGLIDLVYTPRDGEGTTAQWPTLRTLIERGERVVVLADNQGGASEWYLPTSSYLRQTPFSNHTQEDFDCTIDRGNPDARLLLVNHWIAKRPPDRAEAAIVNREDVLRGRIEQCRRDLGQLPNIIAVDFFSIGDVLRVTDAVNQ